MSPPLMIEAAPAYPVETAVLPAKKAKPAGFPGLHGLRGALAVWVVLYHATPKVLEWVGIGHYAYLTVDVFFAMSGFILMHTHGRDFASLTPAGMVRFYELRFWRTYPAHFAAIVVALAVSIGIVGFTPSGSQFLYALAFLNTWNLPIDHAINTPIWSLRMEWLGYLAMPLAFCLLCRLRSGGWAVILALAVAVAQAAAMHAGNYPANAFTAPGALIRMAGGCTLGALIYVARDHWLLRLLRGDIAFAALLVGAMVLAHSAPLAAAPILSLLTIACAFPGRWSARLMTCRPAMFLGQISFSLYLIHMPIMCAFIALQHRGLVPPAVASGATLLLAGLAAVAMCRWVEEPARRAGRRVPSLTGLFVRTPRPRAASALG